MAVLSSPNISLPQESIPKGYKKAVLNNFTPEQMELFQSIFAQLSPDSFLSKIASGDQEAFAEMEAPALKQFAGMQGNLASRFSGMGLGARHGSGFSNTMNQASKDFAQQLQSNRMDIQKSALKDLMDMSNTFLNQRPQDTALTEKDDSFLSGLSKSSVPLIVSAFKSFFGI